MSGDKNTSAVVFYTTAEQKALLEQYARQQRLSVSSLLRNLVSQHLNGNRSRVARDQQPQ